MTTTPDPMNGMIQQLILQLPNFVGLVLALLVVLRQNMKLSDALIKLIRDCDCKEQPPVVQVIESPGSNQRDQPPPT